MTIHALRVYLDALPTGHLFTCYLVIFSKLFQHTGLRFCHGYDNKLYMHAVLIGILKDWSIFYTRKSDSNLVKHILFTFLISNEVSVSNCLLKEKKSPQFMHYLEYIYLYFFHYIIRFCFFHYIPSLIYIPRYISNWSMSLFVFFIQFWNYHIIHISSLDIEIKAINWIN